MKALLGLGTALIGSGFRGLVDFRFAGVTSETLRLIQELSFPALQRLRVTVKK
jgi:hypothetical protein